MSKRLRGVFAAVATASTADREVDCAKSIALGHYLLSNGCDGLNVLGTTGEATSFSLEQRRQLMTAYAQADLPLARCMVGTGAAAVGDAIALTRHAADLGFAAALLLPPFYYKGVPDDGLVAYVDAIVSATAAKPIPLYLYHFPAQSGVPWHPKLVRRLIETFGDRSVRTEGFLRRHVLCPRGGRHLAGLSTCFRLPRPFCLKPATEHSRAAFPPPPISMPICAGGPGATVTRPPTRRPLRSANCLTAKRWYPGSRPCSPTFTWTQNGSD